MSRPIPTRRPLAIALALAALALAACRGPVRSALPDDAPAQVRDDAEACDDGEPTACANVAVAWVDGTLGVVDEERAVELFASACDGGAALACVGLAGLVPADEAAPLLDAACASEAIACLRQGDLLVGTDPAAARVAYVAACDGRVLEGCARYAHLLLDGIGGPADPEEGLSRMARACGEGSMMACREQALVRRGRGEDPALVMELLQYACRGGDGEACAVIADTWEAALSEGSGSADAGGSGATNAATPGGPRDVELFRRRACELGHAAACEAAD